MDNIKTLTHIKSLDFYYIISGFIEIIPQVKNTEPNKVIKITNNNYLNPQNLEENGIKFIEKLEIKQITKVLYVPNIEYHSLVDVFSYKLLGFYHRKIVAFQRK